MEPISLTCPKCAASWKLIKAGTGPITCPQCKAPLDGAPAPTPPEPTPAPDKPSEPAPRPASAVPPLETKPLPALSAVPLPAPARAEAEPFAELEASFVDIADPRGADARSARRDYDDPAISQYRPRPRWHPLVTVAVILLLMMLIPITLIALLFAVCALTLGG